MQYNKPFDQANPAAGYVNGNPATNTAGSIPCAEGLEYPQREIVNAIAAAGLVPSNGDLTQLSKAISLLASLKTTTILTSRQIVGGNLWQKSVAGTYPFVVPDGVNLIRVCLWAGGAAGGSSTAAGNVGSGGSGGGYAEGIFVVTPGQTLNAIVGVGGNAVSFGNGVGGGTTSVTGLSSAISATGGGGGVVGNNGPQSQYPEGGQGFGGQIQRTGRFGGVGLTFGSGIFAGGFGGASGYQGADAQFGLNVGIPGIAPGGGGGGANNGQLGGAGAPGQVSIYY